MLIKKDNIISYILRPTLKDLYENNVYKLNHEIAEIIKLLDDEDLT